MWNREVKDLLDEFKSTDYRVYEVKNDERIDHVLNNFYGDDKDLIYMKLFAYLNNIIYIFDDLETGDLVKIYDLDIFVQLAKQKNIDITEFTYK